MLDAHLHLCDDLLFPQADEIVNEAFNAGVKDFLLVVTNESELNRAYELKKKFPFIKLAASTTPHEALHKEDPFYPIVKQAAETGLIQAIGETGLEYFHPGMNPECQKIFLRRYLQLAEYTKKPIVFHCRDGFEDLFKELRPFNGKVKGMVHCFTGSYEEAIKAIELNLKISISGIVTFKKSEALQETVSLLPLDSLLIETDSPYLAPLSMRGKINKPIYIQETYKKVAELKKITLEELETAIRANFLSIF